MCVCVFFPFILDINGRTSRGLTGGRSHRIFHPPSFCGACFIFLARRIQPFLSLIDREGGSYGNKILYKNLKFFDKIFVPSKIS